MKYVYEKCKEYISKLLVWMQGVNTDLFLCLKTNKTPATSKWSVHQQQQAESSGGLGGTMEVGINIDM